MYSFQAWMNANTLVATNPVRIFVDVPQSVAPSVRTGTEATITLRFTAEGMSAEECRDKSTTGCCH